MDTIYALATAPGRAGIAVVRVSGPDAVAAAERLTGPLPAHGRGLRAVRGADGGLIDEALVLTFAEGRSFTGEAVVEFHLHGSRAVVAALLGELRVAGLRPAEAGEFTRRAMENGQLDLAQVEGLADLIDAETEAQRRQAARVLTGALGALAEGWRARLIRAAALVEATIDFVDEEVPEDVAPEVGALLAGVRDELRREARGAQVAERIRDGFEVAIVGPPNIGKSTLLNRLAGREAAITSEIAGTTRDVIEVRMDLAGLPVTILDTAGLREGGDTVERIGIDRARERAGRADLRVCLVAPGAVPEIEVQPDDIVLEGKADEGGGVSGKTGAGVDALVSRIGAVLGERAQGVGVALRERHRDAMLRGAAELESALGELPAMEARADIVAEHVRGAIRAVESLTGRVDVEDVLDDIFSSFCIGK